MLARLKSKKVLGISAFLLIVILSSSTFYLINPKGEKVTTGTSTDSAKLTSDRKVSSSTPSTSQTVSLDLTKLPLGDKKTSTTAKKGYVFSCQTSFNGGGAFTAGPWIDQNAKTWDLNKKVSVDGEVNWQNRKWTVNSSGTSRSLVGNGFPDHTTGTYPIKSTDDAYQYDRNPNSIKEQSLSYTLPTNPTMLANPECVGGEVGVMLSGIPIFNGFDAAGRDAVAWEVQDSCGGHPQSVGQYHYHGYSKCLKDTTAPTEHSSLIGYAFDGFGIYGLKGELGAQLGTEVLDECHGHTHNIFWDGQTKSMYHYHLTYDFPYSVGCFRAAKAVTGPSGGIQQTQMPPAPSGQKLPPKP